MNAVRDFLQALKFMRRDWESAQGHRIDYCWSFVIAFFIPGVVYRWWCKWVYRPIRYRVMPWYIDSEVLDCPLCSIAFLEGDEDTRHDHYGFGDHPSLYDHEDEEW